MHVPTQVDCLTEGYQINKTCLQHAKPADIVPFTYGADWGPVTDGVTFPQSPRDLLAHGLVNNATVVFGANTNDSNLFLFQAYTKGMLPQPNNDPTGGLIPVRDFDGV